MSTYVLSYPGQGFRPAHVASDANYNVQLALKQWLELCDEIVRAGGHILVLDPSRDPALFPPSLNPVYASRMGAPFLAPTTGSGPIFLRSRGDTEGPPADRDPVRGGLESAGLKVEQSPHRWQGQSEIIALPRNRFLLTYGPHSDVESCDEVKRHLPMGAHVLCIEMARGCGQGALLPITTKGGAHTLLVDRHALKSHTPEDIGRFVPPGSIEVYILSAEDVEARACESLCLRGTLILPTGTSTHLRGQLVRRGFQAAVADVSAFFGKERGGPRILVNEWPGFVLAEESPSYALRRGELYAKLEHYPAESAKSA